MDFLRLQNWKIIGHEENDFHLLIYAEYDLEAENCLNCSATKKSLYRYGRRYRKVKDFPAQGKYVVIRLSVQRYKCLECNKTFTQKVDEIAGNMRITQRFWVYIARQCVEKTVATVSRDTGVHRNVVEEIFTTYANNQQIHISIPTPEVIGIDGVHVGKKERCILTDIKNRRFIGLYKNIDTYNVKQYLLDLKNKGRIKVVTMDMSRSFRSAVKKILGKDVIIVIDKYHVQRMGNKAIILFLRKIRESLNSSQRKKYLRSRFLLQERSYNLSEEKWEVLKKWGNDIPDLVEVYNLKEEFLQIWSYTERQKAIRAFNRWKNKIPTHLRFLFKEIVTAFNNWKTEIFNYFDVPVTNAYTESANNLIKMIKRQSPGISIETLRAKMLCRSLNKLTEEEKGSPIINDYCFVKPKKRQRILKLRQGRLNTSVVFALLFPKEPSFQDRFKPYIPLFHRNK